MLEITHVSKRFAHLQALGDLSLHLADGELVGLVGANGSGKSTTMRIIMGVLDSGTVTWRGSPVDARVRRRIGYMPEERGLYPRMRVREQLIYLARLHGVPAHGARRLMREWTERLGLVQRRGDEVQALSLGNQQRVQLAAALVGLPDPVWEVCPGPDSTAVISVSAAGPTEQPLLAAAHRLGALRELGAPPTLTVLHSADEAVVAGVISLLQQQALAAQVAQLGGDPATIGRAVSDATPDVTELDPPERGRPTSRRATPCSCSPTWCSWSPSCSAVRRSRRAWWRMWWRRSPVASWRSCWRACAPHPC